MHRRRTPRPLEPLEQRTLLAWNPAGAVIDQDDAAATYPAITGKGVTVAVLDTGVDYNHPALGGGFGPGHRVKGGHDFADNDDDPMDTFGHGTNVTGIIAASPFTIGSDNFQGIAPEAEIVAVRIAKGGESVSDATLENALQWVEDHRVEFNISVVNISFGAGTYSTEHTIASISDNLKRLKDAGVLIVSPSGNNGTTAEGIEWPAADPSVAAVGSVSLADAISSFTQRGKLLDLLTPGESVGTTNAGGTFGQVTLTSFSSPVAAGAAALLKQVDPTLRADDMLSILRASGARKDDSSFGSLQTYSRLDLDNAITMAFQRAPNAATDVGNLGDANDLAYDRDGVLHFAYYDPAIRNIKYATRNTSGFWSATKVIDTTGNDVGATLSLALDPTGKPALAYYDATNGDADYARFDGLKWRKSIIDSKNIAGQFPSLAFDSAGNPVVGYYRKTSGDLRVMRHDGTQWVRNEVDVTDNVGQFDSLAVSPNGTIGVAYADATTGDLKYAQTTGTGGVWSVENVDDLRGTAYISLAFNNSNQPAISYYDAYPADLKFASKSTGSWQNGIVAQRGAQGLFTSLWFDNSNNANIVYYNRKADGNFRVTGNLSGWTAQQLRLPGGPRGNATPRFDGTGGSYSWFSDEKLKLLTGDV